MLLDYLTKKDILRYRAIVKELGLRKKGLVKVLGDGEITKKIDLKVHAISEVAKGKIESAGGSVEIIKE